ncbi:phenylacetone monooxygenase [Ceratocystis lukuohia]|uniref:Phenylacetone monooxygenase n=1 Tax=Ceratocystis lukuohia TaxID=2019550 RepID=A0ABR4MAW2_9PEZI
MAFSLASSHIRKLKTRICRAMSRHLDSSHPQHENAHSRASSSPESSVSSYTIQNAPIDLPRPVRIITIGAGASGINLIRTLRLKLGDPFEHVVYEKNPQIGGTWYENRYPGCRCDVPSMSYQFSWKKSTDWTNLCASAAEIESYLCAICDEEGMHPLIKLSHTIVNAAWDEDTAMWEVTVEKPDGSRFVDKANFLIDASGILNKWQYPKVSGLDAFSGQLIHTANWPTDGLSVAGKRVALIGNGASGVQVLPWLAENAASLHHVIRSPTWILPPRVAMMKMGPMAEIIGKIELDDEDNFTAAQIARFKEDTDLYNRLTQAMEDDMHVKFAISLIEDSPQEKWASQKCREFMTAMLGGDETLCKALIPDFSFGCKRITPAPGYLEAFRKPSVRLVKDTIAAFEEKGLRMANGDLVEVDVIVCATGFESSFRPTFPIIGRRGNLQDIWAKEEPKSYMSLAIADMPNFFKFLGPNAPIAHGSVFSLSEHIATYIARAISKARTQNIRAMTPSTGAVEDYHEHVTKFMPRTTWAGNCSSWYKGGKTEGASINALHPGSRLHFIKMLEDFRGEDWDIEYRPAQSGDQKVNRFAYLGNGFTIAEVKNLKAMAAANAAQEEAKAKV